MQAVCLCVKERARRREWEGKRQWQAESVPLKERSSFAFGQGYQAPDWAPNKTMTKYAGDGLGMN